MRRAFLALVGAALLAPAAFAADGKFEWSTKSAEAKTQLLELQTRIESFQFGPDNQALAQKIAAADPAWCMGAYYLSAVVPGPDGQAHLDKAG